MPRLAWLTPETAAGSIACRRLHVPVELLPVVNGALLHLVEDFNWELHGTMTVEEAIDLCQAMIDDYWDSGETCMIGSIQPYANAVLPDGVLACDGSSYLRTSYPLLYAALDAVYITDADNFVVPDLRGRGVVGAGSGVGLTPRSQGDQGGVETHQLVIDEMPSHSHSVHLHDPNLDSEAPGIPDIAAGIPLPGGTTGSTGGDGAHENMPPFEALTWGIVAIETGEIGEGGSNPFALFPSVQVVNTTSKTAIVSHVVPGGAMGNDGMLELTVDLIILNGSGSPENVTIDCEFGSAVIGAPFLTVSTSSSRRAMVRVIFTIQNDGADNSQLAGIHVLNGGQVGSVLAPATNELGAQAFAGLITPLANVASEDTSVDQTLLMSITLAVAHVDFMVESIGAKVLQAS